MQSVSPAPRPRVWLRAHPLLADLAAATAGAVLVLAFAPFEWRVFAVLSPAVLMISWLESAPRRAFWRGYLFGLAFFSIGVSWVFNSIHEFGQAPAWLAGGITLLFVLVLALFPALTGFLVKRGGPRSESLQLLIGFPAVWTLLEWIRSWLFTGFPWLLLGQAQVDTWLAGSVPVLGALGASWLTWLSAGLLVLCLAIPDRRRWLAVAGIAFIWLGSAALERIEWTRPSGEPLIVSLVQGNIPQEDKWREDLRQETLDLYAELTRTHWESDLIVWPETAVPMFYRQVAEDYLRPLAKEARAHDTELLLGVFTLGEEGASVYNSVVYPGDTPQFYHKRHLVPFGEYIPLRDWLTWMGGMLVLPMADISSGSLPPLIHLEKIGVGVSICYEDAYGAEILDAFPGAELLVNVSNDGWFGDSLAPHQHLEIARLRALETGRYLLRATNTGISAIIGPNGEIIERAPQFETHVLTTMVTPRRGLTPFARWGNRAVILLLSVLLLAAVLVSRHAKQDNRQG